MMPIFYHERWKRWLRFLIGGGINTAFTYLLYIGINVFLNYQLSYFIAYATGIIFSYWFNARVVFRVPLSWTGIFSYPLVYVLQYFSSAFLLGGLVEFFDISEVIAPLAVTIAMFPITYFMSKLVLAGRAQKTLRASQGDSTH